MIKQKLDQYLTQIINFESNHEIEKFKIIEDTILQDFSLYLQKQKQRHFAQYIKKKVNFVSQKQCFMLYKQKEQDKSLNKVIKKYQDKKKKNEALLQNFMICYEYPNVKSVENIQNLKQEIYLYKMQNESLKQLFTNSNVYKSVKQKALLLQNINQNAKYFKNLLLEIKKQVIDPKQILNKETLKIFHYLFQKIRSQPTLILLSYPKKGKNLSLYFRMIDYEQFQRLFDIVSLNENNINRFVIKFMDNDFNQLKCDLLKTSFQKMKNLEQLRIQNYYSECKMGVFDQFNWHPYRRKIEIFSKKW